MEKGISGRRFGNLYWLLAAILVAAMGLSLAAQAASAAGSGPAGGGGGGGEPQPEGTRSVRGDNAYAYWEECTTSGEVKHCEGTSLQAFDGRERNWDGSRFDGTRACVDIYRYSYTPEAAARVRAAVRQAAREDGPLGGGGGGEYEHGCATAPKGTFAAGKRLGAASLPKIRVQLQACVTDPETGEEQCENSRKVRVSASWKATGAVRKSRMLSEYEADGCKETLASRGLSRDAAPSGTLNGVALEGAQGGSIVRHSETETRHCE